MEDKVLAEKKIQNIILDLGGVILNIQPDLAKQSFQQLGITDIETCYSELKQKSVFKRLERGEISEQQFYDEIRRYVQGDVSNEKIEEAWNTMIFDIPAHRVAFLREIKSHYKLFLLSNTNAIHVRKFEGDLQVIQGEALRGLFHKAYYSHEMGARKPEAKVYQMLLEEQDLNPAETLFIDDWETNIEAANALGIQTYWLRKGEEFNSAQVRKIMYL